MGALSPDTLSSLPEAIARPGYDIGAVRIGIVHLGLGAFHRAHEAVYTDAVLADDLRWGICGVSLKTPRSIDALTAQHGLYTVVEKGAGSAKARVIGALRETHFLGVARALVLARIADPAVSVVSLTVTEKGYCHDPATGRLDLAHPEIAHDLAHPEAPVSAVGVLVAGLAARRAARAGAISVLCCDNLPRNGRTVGAIVAAFALARDAALADWIGAHVAFPGTMVDRIVPAVTPADLTDVAHLLGVADAAPVVTEPYKMWVIEERFAAARPRWERAGAIFVADVTPYETMKLRLLNGSHSALAYLGSLLGYEFLWRAASDPLLAAFVERMMRLEVIPTLVAPPGTDFRAYCGELMARFRNPALPHTTRQIAMDGSQKLPQRLIATVRDRLHGGGTIEHLAVAIAGWICYASDIDADGEPVPVSDPMAGKFASIAASARGNASEVTDGFLAITAIFGADLSVHPAFRATLGRAVGAMFRDGVRSTLSVQAAQRLG